MENRLHASLLAALLLGASPALAQTTAPPAAGNGDAPGPAVPPSDDPCTTWPDITIGQSLTSQLARCDGVLTPPETGPSGIEAPVPAPDPGTTPVIPPGAVPDQPASPDGANPT